MNLKYVGDGKVVLIAGGGRCYTDIAARFVRSERSIEDIIASPYDKKIVGNILKSGHKAAVEFDYFLFGVEGYARVTEVQLVRKRLASYMIKTGRADKNGKRSFDMVIPRGIEPLTVKLPLDIQRLSLKDGSPLADHLDVAAKQIYADIDARQILTMIETWYDRGVKDGMPEEDLRYLKPQATEFKAIIGMNAHALLDWFAIRTCKNAQREIRDMANKMMALCKEASPDVFANAGANCKVLGYCPENRMQHDDCRGKIPTQEEAMALIKKHYPKQRQGKDKA
ncbi:MAG: FAD-dependent thymidylate synthase [Syntrophomonadaceae bacterium]|nr:FAD-dependent thymidylate synthase [Syntrophomonadaceae bacterium]